MFEVGVVGQFEAAHQLKGDFGPAARPHGHTYRVEVTARGARLRPDGTLLDLGGFRDGLDRVLNEVNYRCLNDLAVFRERNSTVEVVAEELHRMLSPVVRALGAESVRVQVWESPLVFAAYDG